MIPRGLLVGLCLSSAVLSSLAVTAPVGAQEQKPSHVKASLVAESDAVAPGKAATIGIRLQHAPGWHTYWRNPGDSGLPTRVRWTLPAGFEAGEIQWPAPLRFKTGPLVSYGYAGDLVLPVEVKVPSSARGTVTLSGRVDWLECEEACIPGRAELTLALPVRPAPAPGPHAPLVAEARRQLPARDAAWRFAALPAADGLSLQLQPARGQSLTGAYFYPITARLVDYSKPQPLAKDGAGWRLEIARDPNGDPSPRLAGVLVADTAAGQRAVAVDVPIAAAPGAATRSNKEKSKP